MTNNRLIRIILLSCAEYPDNDQFHSAVTTLSASSIAEHGFARLQDTRLHYSETRALADPAKVNAFEAIESARNFHVYHGGSLGADQPAPGNGEPPRIRSELVFDETACFMLVTEVLMAVDGTEDLVSAADKAFQGRALFRNLGILDEMTDVFRNASAVVADIVNQLRKKPLLAAGDIVFSEESTLPLLVSDLKNTHGVERVFDNEELNSGFQEDTGLTGAYSGSLFYAGWNYTIATHFPPEVMTDIISLVARSQMAYFSLRHFKDYFETEFSETIRNMKSLKRHDIEDAERIRLIYYDMTARMDRYVNSLFPKYRKEVERLLERWNCSEDRNNIKNYIQLNADIKENIHNKKMERSNERQNRALAIIALLQLVSLYESIDTAYTLSHTQSFLFYLGTGVIAVSVLGYILMVLLRE